MDMLTIIGLIAGIVTVVGFLYMLIWGQKSIREVLDERKTKRTELKTSRSTPKSNPYAMATHAEPTQAEGFVYDVFVSYSSTNKDWVRKTFIPSLESTGLKVCDYYRDFEAGASIVKEMERAVLQSRKTIPVLSPQYLRSGWTEFESLMLQTLDAANRDRRLLPVILEACELPLRIQYINCINFANPDDIQLEWHRLWKALEVTRPPVSPHRISTPVDWRIAHPYPMPPNFTGRAAELNMLDSWLADDKDRLFILRALGGFGKSALTWQWLNTRVNSNEWGKVLLWSFYEGDASFEHFIEEALRYLKLEIPQGQRTQVDELLRAMQSQKLLLIMDGFERALRAYGSLNAAYQGDDSYLAERDGGESNRLDCVNINAEIFLRGVCVLPGIKGKILLNTRLTPRAVKPRGECLLGCREEKLEAMQKEDAVAFYQKQKIKGTRMEIEAACASYGYHPLSLRLLAGRILKDLHKPGDISVAQTIEIIGDLKQHQNHVLKIAYDSLSLQKQNLLGQIACFRFSTTYNAIKAVLNPTAKNRSKSKNAYTGNLEEDLQDLIERGILNHAETENKYDLHPIVRRYTYGRMNTSERTPAHIRLRDYFAGLDKPGKVQNLNDLNSVIELYHHTVQATEPDKAFQLFRDHLARPLYFQLGQYQLIIELLRLLFISDSDAFPGLKDEQDSVWVLNTLANAYSSNGQPFHAIPFFEKNIQMSARRLDRKNEAIGLENLAAQEICIGSLRKAEAHLRRATTLCWEAGDELNEAVGHQSLSHIMSYRGAWRDAEQELEEAYKYDKEKKDLQGLCIDELYRTMYFLLKARDVTLSPLKNGELALGHAQRALDLAEENARTNYPVERDLLDAHWLLGAAHRLAQNKEEADRHLNEALSRCRAINNVNSEASILLDLARLRYDQKNYEEAKNQVDEALTIARRCGYILQGADLNLFLAQYAFEQENNIAKAKEHTGLALRLAHCDDGPPHYYKVSYEEAERMMAKLNN